MPNIPFLGLEFIFNNSQILVSPQQGVYATNQTQYDTANSRYYNSFSNLFGTNFQHTVDFYNHFYNKLIVLEQNQKSDYKQNQKGDAMPTIEKNTETVLVIMSDANMDILVSPFIKDYPESKPIHYSMNTSYKDSKGFSLDNAAIHYDSEKHKKIQSLIETNECNITKLFQYAARNNDIVSLDAILNSSAIDYAEHVPKVNSVEITLDYIKGAVTRRSIVFDLYLKHALKHNLITQGDVQELINLALLESNINALEVLLDVCAPTETRKEIIKTYKNKVNKSIFCMIRDHGYIEE